jgi:hypothetical protein
MSDPPAASPATECPPWCHVDHTSGRAIHKTCSGEVLWRNGCVAVELAQYRGTDLIVLSNFSDDENPVGANLTADEAKTLRDALDSALALMRTA